MDYKSLVHVYWTQFQTVRFHLRLTDHASAESLVLPEIFAKNVKKLGSSVRPTLSTNKKSKWPVKLKVDRDGNVLLTDGWKEFAKAHFLKKDDILIFKYYVDQFRFKVTVYDGQTGGQNPSTFYVCRSKRERDDVVETDEDKEEYNATESDSYDGSGSNGSSSQSARKKAGKDRDDKRGPGRKGVPRKRGRGHPPKAKEAKEPDDDHSDSDDNTQQSARYNEAMEDRNRTMEKANEMKKDGEYVLYMTPSCVNQRGYTVSCSKVWAKEHGLRRKQEVEFHCKGKTWRVDFYLDPLEKNAAFRRGWKDFVTANRIEVGDACIFGFLPRSVGGRVCIAVRIVKGESESED